MKSQIKLPLRVFLIVAASVMFALNITALVRPGCLFPGGFSGVALLAQRSLASFIGLSVPYSVLTYAFNIVPVIIGWKFIGKRFTALSCLLIVLSGLFTDLFGKIFPGFFVTDDVILCAVFGGIINGLAVSLCLFAESSSGGTDFIAIFISEKTGKSAWNYIFAFNVAVLFIAGLLFGWNAALYSIIFQFASTQALNLFYKKYEKTTLLIITDRPHELYEVIKSLTNHDATIFEGTGAFSEKKHSLLYTVVASSETGQLEKEIKRADSGAFINVIKSKEIIGKFFKRAND